MLTQADVERKYVRAICHYSGTVGASVTWRRVCDRRGDYRTLATVHLRGEDLTPWLAHGTDFLPPLPGRRYLVFLRGGFRGEVAYGPNRAYSPSRGF